MSKTGDEIYMEREEMLTAKLTKDEKLLYDLYHLAELIADDEVDAKEWLDVIVDAIDFIKARVNTGTAQ